VTDYLTPDDLLSIAEAATGRPPLVREAGLLAAAVARPRASAFGEDAYPTLWDKAAALFHSLARYHPLVDGNKRLAWTATVVFLAINGERVEADLEAALALTLDVATGAVEDIPKIADRLRGMR
jgi:death-on-curing protein